MIKLFYLLLYITSSYSLELVDAIEKRATDDFFYNQINKINNLNYYINNFIINNGKVPTRIDLTSTYSNLSNAIWPKTYLANTDINFNVDLTKGEVKYTNITSSTSATISNIFKYNFAHKSDTIINTHDSIASNFFIIMPFNLELIKFSKKINDINNDGLVETMVGTQSDIPCNYAIANRVLYMPNGSTDFSLFFCNGANYRPLAMSKSKLYKSSLTDYGINTAGSVVYSNINVTNVKINIYDNHKLEKRLVR